MKKQITPKKQGLSLSKKTIANLEISEMSKHIGGGNTQANTCVVTEKCPPFTKKCRPSW